MAVEKKTKSAPAKAVTAVKKENTKPGFFARIGKWFRDMRGELKKVMWPSTNTLAKNTLVSVSAILVSAVVLWGFDELAQVVVKVLFTLAG